MSLYPRPPLEKTRLCQYHLLQRCRYGTSCSFAHSALELRVAPASVRKTKLCPLFASGCCFDSFCNYAHGFDEMRVNSCLPSPPSDQYFVLLDMLNQVLADQQHSLLDQVSHF
jgi:hypothetical protein